jgi:molybdopterin molybdotransferase
MLSTIEAPTPGMFGNIACLVLAGGHSSRMASALNENTAQPLSSKALLPWHHNQQVIDAVLAQWQSQVATVWLSGNQALPEVRLPWLTDPPARSDGATSPLAGLAAGLAHLQSLPGPCTLQWLFVVSCDSPDLPTNTLACLVAAANQNQAAVIAASDTQLHPVIGLWHYSMADAALAQWQHGPPGLKSFVKAYDIKAIEVATDDQFINLNTPEQYQQALAQAPRFPPQAPTLNTVSTAMDLLDQALASIAGGSTDVPLQDAAGEILAVPLIAAIDAPRYPTSAMDGIAFAGAQQPSDTVLRIVGQSLAGQAFDQPLATGCAARITTGAVLPQGANTVCPQEHLVWINQHQVVLKKSLLPGANVRQTGEDFVAGQTAIEPGSLLHAGHVAIAAALGFQHLSVKAKPRVGVISIGAELMGLPQAPDHIFDANTPMLLACLQQLGLPVTFNATCGDDPDQLQACLQRYLKQADLILCTGGLAEGQADPWFIATSKLGAAQKLVVQMRPGKRIGFATTGGVVVLGLPGNPTAALLVYLGLVEPCLARLIGKDGAAAWQPAVLAHDFGPPKQAVEFHRVVAKVQPHALPTVFACGPASPSRLSPWSKANAVMRLDQSVGAGKAGATVAIRFL